MNIINLNTTKVGITITSISHVRTQRAANCARSQSKEEVESVFKPRTNSEAHLFIQALNLPGP